MDFGIKFWTIFFFASITLFAGLSVIVSIDGLFNLHSLFKNLAEHPDRENKVSALSDSANQSE